MIPEQVNTTDFKYFDPYKTYKFYYITLANTDLDVNGLTKLTARAVIDNVIYAKGLLTFNVESSVVQYDPDITQSQYDYLLEKITIANKIGYVELDPSEDNYEITDNQLLEMQKGICVIKYTDTFFYVKISEIFGDTIIFEKVKGEIKTDTIEIGVSEILIDVADKTYSLVGLPNGVAETYKTSVVDNLIAGANHLIASEFSSEEDYSENELVIYNNKLYLCKSYNTGDFDSNNFTETNVDTAFTRIGYLQINNTMGTLTSNQLLEIKKPICFIKYNNRFYKKSQESSNIYYFYNDKEYSGGTPNTLTQSWFTINPETGYYTYNTQTKNFYDDNNISTLLGIDLYNTTTTYEPDDLVLKDGTIYKCVNQHSGLWLPTDFTPTSIIDLINN
jgi:hypothetical protein